MLVEGRVVSFKGKSGAHPTGYRGLDSGAMGLPRGAPKKRSLKQWLAGVHVGLSFLGQPPTWCSFRFPFKTTNRGTLAGEWTALLVETKRSDTQSLHPTKPTVVPSDHLTIRGINNEPIK